MNTLFALLAQHGTADIPLDRVRGLFGMELAQAQKHACKQTLSHDLRHEATSRPFEKGYLIPQRATCLIFSAVRSPAMPSRPDNTTHSASVSSMGGGCMSAGTAPRACSSAQTQTSSG